MPRHASSSRRARSRGRLLAAAVAITVLLVVASCSPPPPPGPITVHGAVVGVPLDPMPGMQVYLNGAGTPVSTGADGTFTLADVTTPYDLVVVDVANQGVLTVRGLTRDDPTLQLPTSGAVSRSADFSGDIAGASVGVGQSGAAVVASGAFGIGIADIAAGTAFSDTFHWYGAASQAVTIFGVVLELDGGTGLPSVFHALGSVDTTLQDGVPVAGLSIPLAPVGTVHLGGTVTPAPGVTSDTLALAYVFRKGARDALIGPPAVPAGATFDLALPDAASVTATLIASGTAATGTTVRWKRGLTAADDGVDLDLPASPALSAPADGAAAVAYDTTFRWSAVPGSVYLLLATPDTTGPSLALVTAEPEATLPDLSALGLAESPAGAGYAWKVWALGAFASVDDAAGTAPVLTDFYRVQAQAGEPARDGWYAESVERSLTFAP